MDLAVQELNLVVHVQTEAYQLSLQKVTSEPALLLYWLQHISTHMTTASLQQ